jgi:putative spermidine/putrescine transport system substrate-binding protein
MVEEGLVRLLRSFGLTVASIVAISGVAGAQDSPDAGVELTWVDGGGAYHDAVTQAWLDQYAADTGVTFAYVGQTDNALVKAQVEAGAPTYSVYNGDNTWGLDTDAEWLEPLDYSIITNRDEMVPGFATDYRIANMIYSMALAYNTEATGGVAPNGWADFFDLEKFPGKRGVMDYSVGGIFEIALLADGVAPEDLYPLDLDRAIAKLDTIKDEIVFWGSGAESEDLITTGEVAMAMMYNSRAWDAKAVLEAPVEIAWPQQILAAAYLTVPKGTPNKDAAMRLIDYITSAEENGKLSTYFTVAPTNTLSDPDPALAPELPTSHLDEGYAVFDDQWIAENQAMVEEVYQDWKSS